MAVSSTSKAQSGSDHEQFIRYVWDDRISRGQSIVPIVAWNDGDKEIRCIGTGFFISASGLLMTAAHVIRDPVDEDYARATQIDKNAHKFKEDLHFGILLPANPAMRNAPFNIPTEMREAKWFMCPFEWMYHWGKDAESPLLHKKPE